MVHKTGQLVCIVRGSVCRVMQVLKCSSDSEQVDLNGVRENVHMVAGNRQKRKRRVDI